MVKILDTIEEYNEAIGQTDVLVVIDFFATWCGPCVRVAPDYVALAESQTDGKFTKKILELEKRTFYF